MFLLYLNFRSRFKIQTRHIFLSVYTRAFIFCLRLNAYTRAHFGSYSTSAPVKIQDSNATFFVGLYSCPNFGLRLSAYTQAQLCSYSTSAPVKIQDSNVTFFGRPILVHSFLFTAVYTGSFVFLLY